MTPLPLCPVGLASQDPGNPERAQLRSPFSQSSKVGREPAHQAMGPVLLGLGKQEGSPLTSQD